MKSHLAGAAFRIETGAVILLAWAVRVRGLGAESLWVDEGYSYLVARRGLVDLLALLAAEDRHPPLHYLALCLSTRLAGTTEYALRLPSALAGTLLVAVAYALGRRAFGGPTALLGATLLALSPFAVWYSQEARMYALLGVLGGLSLLLWLRLLERGGRWTAVGYAVASAAALYTHYYAAFVLLAEGLALLTRRWSLPAWRRGVAGLVGAALLFVPWVPSLARQGGRAASGYQLHDTFGDLLGGLATAYAIGEPVGRWPIAVAAVVLLTVVGAVAAGRVGFPMVLWVATAPVVAYGLSAFAGLEIRATGRMYYVVGLLPFLLLVARGATALRPRPLLPVVAAIGLVSLQGFALFRQVETRQKEDFRGAAALVASREWPGDAVIVSAESIFRTEPFAYYFRGAAPLTHVDPSAADLAERLTALVGDHSRVWLLQVHGGFADPQSRVESWLDGALTPLEDRPEPDVHLRLYSNERRPQLERPKAAESSDVRLTGASGAALDLLGQTVTRDAARASLLRVELVWRALARLQHAYHVALLLTDGSGRVVQQTDRVALSPFYDPTRWQPGEYVTDRYEMRLADGVGRGAYRLKLRFYAPDDGSALATPAGDLVDLGVVRVAAAEAPPTQANGPVLGGIAALAGADVAPARARPGGRLTATLSWLATASPDRDYTVFVHLVGPDGTLRGQHDSPPEAGRRPTSLWLPGDVVRDPHELTIDPAAPPGDYRVMVGLYRPDTGARLPVSSGGDAVTVDRVIQVVP